MTRAKFLFASVARYAMWAKKPSVNKAAENPLLACASLLQKKPAVRRHLHRFCRVLYRLTTRKVTCSNVPRWLWSSFMCHVVEKFHVHSSVYAPRWLSINFNSNTAQHDLIRCQNNGTLTVFLRLCRQLLPKQSMINWSHPSYLYQADYLCSSAHVMHLSKIHFYS